MVQAGMKFSGDSLVDILCIDKLGPPTPSQRVPNITCTNEGSLFQPDRPRKSCLRLRLGGSGYSSLLILEGRFPSAFEKPRREKQDRGLQGTEAVLGELCWWFKWLCE